MFFIRFIKNGRRIFACRQAALQKAAFYLTEGRLLERNMRSFASPNAVYWKCCSIASTHNLYIETVFIRRPAVKVGASQDVCNTLNIGE